MSTVLSGAYFSGSVQPAVQAFGTWRGRSLDACLLFMPSASWTDLEGSPGWMSGYGAPSKGSAPMQIFTNGLIPAASSGATLAAGAGGAYASHWTTFANHCVANGLSSATIRLGHEANGNWYAWSSIGKHADFISNWQAAVTAMRAATGSHLKFNWCVSNGGGSGSLDYTPEGAYPGDAYVDSIGVDVYDFVWGNSGTTAAQRWAQITTGSLSGSFSSTARGLNYWADFADSHGKPLCIPEWGVLPTTAESGGGGGDDPTFVDYLLDYAANRCGTQATPGWEVYFNSNPTGMHSQLANYANGVCTTSSEFPNAAARYQSRMQALPDPTPPPPVVPPTSMARSSASKSYYG